MEMNQAMRLFKRHSFHNDSVTVITVVVAAVMIDFIHTTLSICEQISKCTKVCLTGVMFVSVYPRWMKEKNICD